MLDIIKQELINAGAFTSETHPLLKELAASIPNNSIPDRMKLTLAVSELVLFASQFRRNIAHWNGSFIPINAITFCLSSSGSGKDSSVNALRKCFHTGYHKFDEKRKLNAKLEAIRQAAEAGESEPNQQSTWKKYYLEPNPLFTAPSTVEGYIQHLNELDEAGMASGSVFSGEIGSELISSPVIQPLLQFLAEVYDEGSKEVKIIKNKEAQSKAIKNLPVSALFVGSQANILYDESVKNKFKLEFSTKLARRSFFNFNPEKITSPEFKSISDLLKYELNLETQALAARQRVDTTISSITDYQLSKLQHPIQVAEKTVELFLLYKRYNDELSNTISPLTPISKLVRLHCQWKALKLAGAFAFINQHEQIEPIDYIHAINFTELLDKDMQNFEIELVKEPYEVFATYMNSIAVNDKASISLHQLRKQGYIPLSGKPDIRMQELVYLAASYDTDGLYTIEGNSINFERIIKTEVNGVSFLPVYGDKDQRAKMCASGYEFAEVSFADLAELLSGDYAYSPFKFQDGIRSTSSIISGCKWICLDIDKTTISDTDAHYLLQEFNHHIVRTSDSNNPYKYRLLLELDSYVDISDKVWKPFIKSIAEYFALPVDSLPKAQIFFSYAGRPVLSVTNKKPVEVRDHLMIATAVEPRPEPSKLPPSTKKSQLSNIRDLLWYAFEAREGEGSLSLIRALHHLKDLGATPEIAEQAVREINDYWIYPIDETRFERTILAQIPKIWSTP